MSSWLCKEVLQQDNLREPTFARQSTINWMKALRFEIDAEHGTEPDEQVDSCLSHFKSSYAKRLKPLSKAFVFKPLFSSLTYALTLQTLENLVKEQVWIEPSCIVIWYYCWYGAIRSVLAVLGRQVADTHAAICRAYASNISTNMPSPLNMQALYQKNQDYISELPSLKSSSDFDLSKTFPNTREAAQGMLIQYLSGNAKYYTGLTKDRILKNGKYPNFRTKQAKEELSRQLEKCISFMHCAFRYRGKANYRDGISLTYGSKESDGAIDFVADMTATSQFAFLLALALVVRSPLKSDAKSFIADINKNLRGIEGIPDGQRFWNVI